MLPKSGDRFEEWLRTPLSAEADDPRFEMRRAHPSEFERIYDLVDASFGVRRPRVVYDWLYRRNVGGMANCWIAVEKSGGRVVAAAAHFPWPVARDGEALWGLQLGDVAVAPDFQRQGLNALRRRAQRTHPHYPMETRIGWPNEKSISLKRKDRSDHQLVGRLSEGAFRLEDTARWRGRRWLRRLRLAGSVLPSRSFRARAGHPATGRRGSTVEEVARFDSAFDGVTWRCMRWQGFWCPHDAEFLNWRYLDHPTRSYRALAALEGDEIAGYAVIRTEGSNAMLMEFAAPEHGKVSRLLLRGALEAARESACRRLAFFATPGWRHWSWFRAAGLADRPPGRHLLAAPAARYGLPRLEDWQLVPGDNDSE
jgi:hypothetical protein